MNLNFLFDMCRWQVEEEDVEAVDEATTSKYRTLTDKPSWRLLVLPLILLHKLV